MNIFCVLAVLFATTLALAGDQAYAACYLDALVDNGPRIARIPMQGDSVCEATITAPPDQNSTGTIVLDCPFTPDVQGEYRIQEEPGGCWVSMSLVADATMVPKPDPLKWPDILGTQSAVVWYRYGESWANNLADPALNMQQACEKNAPHRVSSVNHAPEQAQAVVNNVRQVTGENSVSDRWWCDMWIPPTHEAELAGYDGFAISYSMNSTCIDANVQTWLTREADTDCRNQRQRGQPWDYTQPDWPAGAPMMCFGSGPLVLDDRTGTYGVSISGPDNATCVVFDVPSYEVDQPYIVVAP